MDGHTSTRKASTTYQINQDTRLVISDDQVQIQDRGHMTNLDAGEARELAETILADLAERYDPPALTEALDAATETDWTDPFGETLP